MSARAGIVVTGTEVLTGRVSDRNGPWLAERLRELGVDLAHTMIVGDRPQDMRAALVFMAEQGMDLVLTSGGLGPTADDLTAEVVGAFQEREMVLDGPLEARIARIIEPLTKRCPNLDLEAIRPGNRKQATIPSARACSSRSGRRRVSSCRRAAVPRPAARPWSCFPGRRASCSRCSPPPSRPTRCAPRSSGAGEYRQRTLRLFGIPESEIAETLRVAAREGVALERIEVTTCLKRGEVEVVVRYEPDAQDTYDAFDGVVRARHPDTLFSDDGSTVDVLVAALLRGGRAGGCARSPSRSPARAACSPAA